MKAKLPELSKIAKALTLYLFDEEKEIKAMSQSSYEKLCSIQKQLVQISNKG